MNKNRLEIKEFFVKEIEEFTDSLLCKLYDKYKCSTGDIAPEQAYRLEEVINDYALLLAEIAEQNL